MLFAELTEIDDPEPHPADWNMALDEALLLATAGVGLPLLRVYRWARASVSFGYFVKHAEVSEAWPGRDLVRRWTGGGIVPHGDDLTYSLIVPKAHPFARLGPLESYAAIHRAVAEWLRSAGIAAALSPGAAKLSDECFANPAPHDVIGHAGKIAGAAQRRTRLGLLHQGSIQRTPATGNPGGLRGFFGREITCRGLSGEELAKAGELVREKYGKAGWMQRW